MDEDELYDIAEEDISDGFQKQTDYWDGRWY